jgi:tellurite resistance protein
MQKEFSDEYLKTLASAYVWVASADGNVDEAEASKYEHFIVESPFATQFEVEHVRRYFKDMVTMFVENFDEAVDLTKARLKQLKGETHLAEEIIRLCRGAVVGDGKITESEEMALKEIARDLAIDSEV